MNRRNFLRNSAILGVLSALSPHLWANSLHSRGEMALLPTAPLHIRHGLLQGQSNIDLLSNCRWLLGLEQNQFLRNGLEAGEEPFRHFDLQLAGSRLGIGVQGEQLWLCDEVGTLETSFPFTHQTGAYHLIFEKLEQGDSYSPTGRYSEWLLLPLSGSLFLNERKVEAGELYFVKSRMLTLLSHSNARFMLIGK